MVVEDDQVRVLKVKSYETKVGLLDPPLKRQELSAEEVQLTHQVIRLRWIQAILAQIKVVLEEAFRVQTRCVGQGEEKIFGKLLQGQTMGVKHVLKIEHLKA